MQLAEAVHFAVAKGPVPLDEKTKKLLTEETISRLNRLHENVLTWNDWNAEYIDGQLKKFVENEAIGFGKIGPVLRGILSAGHPAPDISKLLASIGREETLVRLTGGLFI